MPILDPATATGWVELVEVPKYIIDEINTNSTQVKIDKTSARTSQLFNHPQSNSPVERIHQVLTHMFLTKNLKNQIFDHINPFGEILASVAWAVRASYNSTTNATPAQLVFGRDMIFNLRTLIDWKALSIRKQKLIDKANLRENSKRIDFDYQEGQQVYIINNEIKRKFESPKSGPYPITDVYTNGTVRIQRGHVNERINIRRLEPHFE